jgi:hypothetical protein
MKTRGVELCEGGLVLPFGRGVPDPFWERLRSLLAKAMLLDEHREDYARERAAVREERRRGGGDAFTTGQAIEEANREERLFRRWVERLGIPVERWPWERGWTEEAVDSYLIAPVKALEAA